MKNGWQRVLSFALAFAMVLGMLPAGILTAQASSTGTFRVGGTDYSDLSAAITAAQSGSDKTIVVTENASISGSYTIPADVTLLLPYGSDTAVKPADDAYPYANVAFNESGNASSPADGNTHVVLTMADSASLNVQGKLILGGVVGSWHDVPNYSGQTSGAHSDIVMNGSSKITVSSGGVMSCLGFVTGSGSIEVKGGSLYQPFVITDYRGGNYTVLVYQFQYDNVPLSPFGSYAMMNVRTKVTFDLTNAATAMFGYCDLYTGAASVSGITVSAKHNKCAPKIIGSLSASEPALFMSSGSMVLTYDAAKVVTTHSSKAGKSTLEISGDSKLGSLNLDVYVLSDDEPITVSTSSVSFPIPYNLDLIQSSGTLTIAGGSAYKILPGGSVTIHKDAALKLDGELAVYDGFVPGIYSTANYPDSAELGACGFNERGQLVVDGTMYLNGAFGGYIETNTTGEEEVNPKIVVASDSTLELTMGEGVVKKTTSVGLTAATTDRTERILPAYVYNENGERRTLVAGSTYYGNPGGGTVESFSYKKYSSETEYTNETVNYTTSAGRTISGSWATGFTITWMNDGKVHYSSSSYTPGAAVTETVSVPEKAGYQFVGWDHETPEKMPRSSLVINAQWEPIVYNVTFDANGGKIGEETSVTNQVTFNTAYTLPADPVREGYTFQGWYNGETKLTAGASKTAVGGETYTAKWTADEHTVTWVVDGETTTKTYAYGAVINKPADPVKTGYTFTGWAGYTEGATMGSSDVTYTAQWKANEYTVTFYDGSEVKNSASVTYGSTYGDVLPEMTKAGYTFTGWYTAVAGGSRVTSATKVTATDNHSLYARWSTNTVTLKFVSDGVTVQTVAQAYGTDLPAINAPEKTGHTFLGWTVNGELVTLPATMPAADTTYTASWQENTYTITFDTVGGTVINEIKGAYGAAITAPADPTKTGYTFAGWDKAIPSTMPAENMTITASWRINQYTITFNTDGGSPIAQIKQDYGTAVTAPDAPTKTGHTFKGWDQAIPATMPAQNMTITAQWTANTYTVTFHENGSAGGTATQSFTYGVAQSLIVNLFTRTGYHFLGWAETADGNVKYSDLQSVSNLTAENGGVVDLYAKWQVNNYTVKYNANGGSGAIAQKTVSYEETFTLAANAFTNSGYKFAGWNTRSDGGGTGYQAGQEVSGLTADNNAVITLYAQWEANTHTLTLNPNGGYFWLDGAKITEAYEIEIEAGDSYSLPTAYRDGYTMECWSDGTNTYAGGSNLTLTEDITLTAQWIVTAADSFTITYKNEYSWADPDNVPRSYTVETEAFTLPTPVRTGYTFIGWTYGDVTEPQTTVTVEKGSIGNLEFTINWKINQYTITFVDAEGVENITADYGTQITAPADPTKEGYTFIGWDQTIPTRVLKDLTITAQWKVNSYKVYWNVDGVVTQETYAYGAAISKPADPSKAGYTFAGWSPEVPETMGAADATYTATWNADKYTVTWLNGDEKTEQTYAYGETIQAPETPTKEGHTFDGWEGFTDGAVMGTSNVTYTAKWTVNSYTVTWNVDAAKTVQTYAYGAEIMPVADPGKTGYTFAGWTPEVAATMGADNQEYTAQWTSVTYQITYILSGGTMTGAPETYTIESAAFTLPKPEKTGYTFTGWKNSTGTVLENVTIQQGTTGNLSFEAQYRANTYTVTFHANSGIGATKLQTLTYDVQGVLESNTFQRTGYTFSGWNTAADGKGTAYADKTVVLNLAQSGNVDLYAQWTPNTYVIAFQPNGGEGTMDTQSVTYGQEAKPLNANAFTLTGHSFTGWNTNQDGSGTAYADLAAVSNLTANMTLYAQWAPNTYSITFDANGGTGTMAAQTFTYGVSQQLTANSFAKTGYTFARWTTAADGTGNAYENAAAVQDLTVSGNVTLYAQWNINQYTITFESNGGTAVEAITRDYGTVINAPQDPTRDGYVFAGWQPAVPAAMPAENVTVTAQWNSYLSMLTAISAEAMADDAVLAQAREYYALMDSEQKETYANSYASHKRAFFELIKEAAIADLEESVRNAAPATNAVLKDDGGASVASIMVDDQHYVEIFIEQPDYPAQNLLFIDFLKILFSNQDIYSIAFPALVGKDDGNGGQLTPYGTGVNTITQMDLMLRIAFAAINEPAITGADGELPYADFINWLKGNRDIVIGVMDGKNVDVTVIAKTPEGIEYEVSYEIALTNRTHNVTWVKENGEADEITTVSYGETIVAPADPTRTGYTFSGWLDADGNAPAAMGRADVSFTAQWTANSYTLTLDPGEGTLANGNTVTVTYDKQYGDLPVPACTGYTFLGWYLGDTPIKNTTLVTITGDVTLTAQWEIGEAYNITYDRAGGEWVEGADPKQTYNVETATFTIPTPIREGYTFLGWTGSNGAVPQLDVTVEKGTTGDLSYTANWQINQYTITFDTDGGSAIAAITQNYGTAVTAPANPTKDGYLFNGWDTEIPATMPAKDITVKALWKVNLFNLIYMVDGEVYRTVPREYGAAIAPEPEPTKTGYTFSGWSEIPATMPGMDVTVTGSFIANTYAVSFDPNYPAAPSVAGITVTYDASYGALPAVSRTGYTFGGWKLDGAAVTAQTVVSTASDHTLTAAWTANTYKVILNANGGSCDQESITVTYDGTYAELPTPTRSGYDFVGWFDGDTQINQDAKVAITAEQTLTARWNASGDTPYVVKHYQQDPTGDSYTLADTENFTGAADTVTQAMQKNYTGFTFNESKSTTSGVIAADGSLVLNVYYDRETYDVVWYVGGGEIRETYRYDAALNVPDTAKPSDDRASYTFTGWDAELPGTVQKDYTFTASYSAHYEAVIGNTTYRTLKLALDNAVSGNMVTLAADAVLGENATVPANVTLLIPCMDNDPGYILRNSGKLKFNPDGTSTAGTTGVGPNAALYRSLRISEGVTLRVEGSVMVNAVTGRPATSGFDQDVTGGYAQINLSGDIVVEDGGQFDSFGYVKGSGTVTAKSGGTVADLYIVRHWRGGTQALKMYEANVYPMNEYDCHNIETDVRVEYGGRYEGMVKMYAGNQYNYTRFPQVDSKNGLIRLAEDAYVTRSYENGREVFRIYGGAEFASSTLNIVGVDLTTAEFIYPIDGDIDFAVYSGRYEFNNDYKFMPGASFQVGAEAELYVNSDKTIVFYQQFHDLDNAGSTEYPSDRGAAVLTVREDGKFVNAGTFAGHIYTETTDILIGGTPQWSAQTREANGLATDAINKGEETYVTIDHVHTMEHPELSWSYGANQSIIWEGFADYSEVQKAIAAIPADLDYYEPESIVNIQPAVDQVEYNLPADRQAEVDAMAQPILDAVAGLVLRKITITFDPNGGTVDEPTRVVDCIGTYGTLPTPKLQYHTFQGWYNAEGERVRNNDALQSKTDIALVAQWKMANADYTAVRKALRKVPSDTELANCTEASVAALNAVLDAVNYNLTADRQAEVDAAAQAIEDAVTALKVLVTLDANGGTLDSTTIEVPYDQEIGGILPVPVREGFGFGGWFDADGSEVKADTVLTAPTTLTAKWNEGVYTITFDSKGGTDVAPITAAYGDPIKAPAAPTREGYTFVGWDPELPATMPASDMTLTALWEKKPAERHNPFVDVAETAYYYEPVMWAVDEGITAGKDETHFAPNEDCTRAQIVTFLWRSVDCPEPKTTDNPFWDVTQKAYYYKSVLWAVENSITSGTSPDFFSPSDPCTRAQAVTFLWRAVGCPEPSSKVNPFEDVASHKYYYDAVLWAVENGITAGKDANHFQPDATCTRAQIVTFLYRVMVEQGIELEVG